MSVWDLFLIPHHILYTTVCNVQRTAHTVRSGISVWDSILKPHEHLCTSVCLGVKNTNVVSGLNVCYTTIISDGHLQINVCDDKGDLKRSLYPVRLCESSPSSTVFPYRVE